MISKEKQGLSNLRNVSVVVNWHGSRWSPLNDDTIAQLLAWMHHCCDERVEFNCKGKVTFVGRLWESGKISSITNGIQTVEALMRSKAAFEDDSRNEE